MTKYFLAFILTLQVAVCFGQKSYPDSLKKFQQEYITDLYKIIKEDTTYIRFFPANKKMVVKASVTLLPNEQPFRLTTSSGKTKDAQKYSLLTFKLNGKTFKLYTYQLLKLKEKAETAHELFLPFTDPTNGKESYGGGRYIDLSINDIKDGYVIIDFNKAYNPYCAFATGYNCPIPPRENDINISIKAGEKYLKDKFHH
jgi:uncharacterized protein